MGMGVRNKIACLGLALGLVAATFVGGSDAMAENRALLIGVGNYKNPQYNLPGIDLDLNIMKDVARYMGYKPSQIKVLRNRQASLANTMITMENWLVKGVGANDRVLLYYSGHGTNVPDQNGDEADQQDEVLTMYDLKVVNVDNKPSLKGVMLDDDLNRILGQIKSRQVLVLVDACHSGTSTKSVDLGGMFSGESSAVEKFFYYPGMSANKGFSVSTSESGKTSDNYVSIGAAQDSERSLASYSGSFFTLGVKQTVEEAIRQGRDLTPEALTEGAASYIARKVSPAKVYHPQLIGNAALAGKPLGLMRPQSGHGPKWQRTVALVNTMGRLDIHAPGKTYYSGDQLELTMEIPESGYLNIISIDSQDKPTVLFPNKFHRSNHVSRGTFRLPGNMDFVLEAQKPFGESLVVAFLSTKQINLFKDGEGQRDSRGIMLDYFPEFSEKSLNQMESSARAWGAKARKKSRGGMLELTTRP